jgi:small-conductance mechanosensitive channel
MLVPILLVVAYIFDLHRYTSVNNIIFIADIIAIIVFIVGMVYIFLTRDQFERKLKPSYQKEFLALIIIVAFGVLGIGILFIYLGGALFYVPHVIIPLFLFAYLILFIVGQKYFNMNLLRR